MGKSWTIYLFQTETRGIQTKKSPDAQKDQGGKKDKINKTDIKPIKCLTTDSSEFVATAGAANAHIDFIGAFNTVSHDILRNKHRMD